MFNKLNFYRALAPIGAAFPEKYRCGYTVADSREAGPKNSLGGGGWVKIYQPESLYLFNQLNGCPQTHRS
jgi:hypothetical protein